MGPIVSWISEQQIIPAGDVTAIADFHKKADEYVAAHRLLEGTFAYVVDFRRQAAKVVGLMDVVSKEM